MTVNEAELTIYLPDKAPLIARCSNGKDSLHGAEKKAKLSGQLYIGPNSLWAQFVTVIVQLMIKDLLLRLLSLGGCPAL